MIDGQPEHIIWAICNDPRHARGKIYDAAEFGRFTLPDGGIRWLIRDGDAWSYTVRPNDGRRRRVEIHRRYDAEPEKGSTYVWPCTAGLVGGQLCKRSFEVREDNLQLVLETVYQGQVASDTLGEPVNLATLRHVASTVAAHR